MRRLLSLVLCWPLLAMADEAVDQIVAARQSFAQQATAASPAQGAPDIENYLLALQSASTLVLIEQVEGVGNRADVRQLAPQNKAAVLQGNGDGNEANIEQIGANNLAIVTQLGSNNQVSMLEQTGANNAATVTQNGNLNAADIHQYGDNNSLTLQQIDSYNSASVTEYGNAALNIAQSNPYGNSASVNALTVSAIVEAGYTSGFGPITTSGAGHTTLNLCSGSAAFCAAH